MAMAEEDMTDPVAMPADDVCHWEATANLALEGSPVQTICQYDLVNDSPTLIHSALRTHPQVILGEGIYSNPFDEAESILEKEPFLNHSDGDRARVDGMLRQIRFPNSRLPHN